MQIRIRKATLEDIPAIHGLVGELARYENAEEEFIASVEEYRKDFLQEVFKSTVAEVDGKVVGMMLYYMTYSTWKGKMLYLEDFVLLESFRRKGIGTLLFDAFLEEARNLGCRLVKWQVLDWNQPALDFYEKYRATIETEWWNGKLFL
ncbi:MAG: GNAT family N-acetyltransferase [Saprospirales bacterium]|nr:GNAT family N-acetyltransferase [Saprospirales bacterium]MBK8491235.1 GNAT family N-acetyltransferase [Saprospirales bacterium]